MKNKKIIHDALWGLAIGDACGVPYEFLTKDLIAKNPCTTLSSGGPNGQPKGTFSDDTQMTLAMIEGMKGKIENWQDDIAKEFVLFATQDKYGHVFDVRNTVVNAVIALQQGVSPKESGNVDSLGNGSVMRMLPLALLFSLGKRQFTEHEKYKFISDISSITHPNNECIKACLKYCNIIDDLIKIKQKPVMHSAIDLNADNGIATNTLDQALYFFINSNSYKEAVLNAVNNGNDTDTVAGMVGTFAGIYYGIPLGWKIQIKNKSLIKQGIYDLNRILDSNTM